MYEPLARKADTLARTLTVGQISFTIEPIHTGLVVDVDKKRGGCEAIESVGFDPVAPKING